MDRSLEGGQVLPSHGVDAVDHGRGDVVAKRVAGGECHEKQSFRYS
jgi:hypothetical protein